MNVQRKYKNFMAMALLAIAFISSCKKEGTIDTVKPFITVEEPMDKDTISDEIHIEFTATDNIALKEVTGKIKDHTGKEVFSKTQSATDLKAFSFHDHYELKGITVVANYTVIITATDKSNNIESKTISVVVTP